jgi:transposase-like protein
MDTPKNLYDWKGGVYMGEKNRHFTREFKLTAVQLVTEKGMPVGKVARDLISTRIFSIYGGGNF